MIAVCLAICALFGASAAVEVSTGLGNIRGVTLKSRLGDDFHAFRGIRYANAPVGPLRFKSPQPVSAWKPKVLDATEDGPICPQTPFNSSDYSEDCLLLNVYTKSLDEKALKPVIIYIHPGGYYAGSGKYKDFSGPQFMMDRDIVFVTINYRLGTLGFLATGTADAPGNAGLKDQVVAFKWVRDHIIKFGGDPNSVTLFGSSSGGFSVGLHLVSPMSKGLFHRGIVMSSSPVYQLPYTTDTLELARRQARLVNCPAEDVAAMVKCLRETPVDEFVRTQPVILEINIDSIPTWRQVIEKDFGQERFLVEDPNESYQTGRLQKVPLIIGMVKDEFLPFAHEISQNETLTRLLNENWETMAPICLLYEQNTPRSREASKVLRKEYLNNRELKVGDQFDDLGKLVSDGIINFGVHRFAHLAARYMPVYYYRFSYMERYSFFYYPKDKPYGTTHLDDLMYLIYFPLTTPSFQKTDPEDKIVERMTRMWYQFAKTGDPNNPRDEFIGKANWQPLDLKKENYLDIGNELVQKQGLYLRRFAIWNRLFPLNWTDKPCRQHHHAGGHHHHADGHHHHHGSGDHHHNGNEDYPEPIEGGNH